MDSKKQEHSHVILKSREISVLKVGSSGSSGWTGALKKMEEKVCCGASLTVSVSVSHACVCVQTYGGDAVYLHQVTVSVLGVGVCGGCQRWCSSRLEHSWMCVTGKRH